MDQPKNLFGLKLGTANKSLSTLKSKDLQKSFVLPQDADSVAIEWTGSFFGASLDMDGTIRDDNSLIYKYREMATHPETEAAIDDIVGEAISGDENIPAVKCVTDKLPFKVALKDLIAEEFDGILRLLKFQTKKFDLFRKWYIDGRLVFHIIVDDKNKELGISELRFVDPVNIQKIKQFKKELSTEGQMIVTDIDEFYVYNKDGFKANAQQGLKISSDAIAWVSSGLLDVRNKKTVGFLHKAIKPLNQLRMMEDSVVIYRMSRAPERRIFYIDVGSLPKTKAEQYVRDLMLKYKNMLHYDAVTGEVRNDKRHMSMLEDFWLPRRDGKGTEVKTLEGAQNLSELDDVIYFQKKLFQCLNVPISRLGGQENKSFSIGRSTEITRDEIKFTKFISRLRNKFSEIFYTLLKTQLLLKNIIAIEDWEQLEPLISFEYAKDSYFSELKENEVTKERLDALSAIDPYIGRFYSEEWVYKNILGFKDNEIERMKKQMAKEKQENLKKKLEDMQVDSEMQQMQQGMNGDPAQDPNANPDAMQDPNQEQPPQEQPNQFPPQQ
jgi:hypothetical protein